MNAITFDHVCKRYPSFTLQDICLCVPQGSVMGLIGQNGAGKSTIIRLLLGLATPDRGSISVLGQTVPDREHIGVVFDECLFSGELTAMHLNRIFGMAYRTWSSERYEAYLKRFDLPPKKNIKNYSRGMKMKLSIAAALSHDSHLLVLDEPTSGLDPVIRDQIIELFYDFTQDETHSILISSHITSDLEKICDYVTFLNKGQIKLSDAKDDLLSRLGLVLCDANTLQRIPPQAIHGIHRSQFSTEVLVERKELPHDLPVDPVTLEKILLLSTEEG